MKSVKGPKSFIVRLGGKLEGAKAFTGRLALLLILNEMTDAEFDALPRSEGRGRLTISIAECSNE